jgi:hypothetical protein
MTPHQFHIGQTVYLRPSAFMRNAAADIYEIRAVMVIGTQSFARVPLVS